MTPTSLQNPADWTASSLLAEIETVGKNPDGSYSRFTFDEPELTIRSWFLEKAAALGLKTSTDPNGNIWAWWGEPGEGAVLFGSHIDSVPGGGAYDGPLGVVSSLVAVAQLQARGVQPSKPTAIVVFADEEGAQFGMPCLGARLATGTVSREKASGFKSRDGRSIANRWQEAGLDFAQVGPVPELLAAECFIELHVEQGRGLIDLNHALAIGTAVRPHGRWHAEFFGPGNHAGTTLLEDRQDPVIPLATFIETARSSATAQPDAVATVGRVVVVPGGTNVIATSATAWLDCRAEEEATVHTVVEEVETQVKKAAEAEGCAMEWVQESWTPKVAFDADLQNLMSEVLGADTPRLSTGAGHDAAVISEYLPAGMLFVRNPTGASHTKEESSTPEDCDFGALELARVIERLIAA